MSQFNCIKAFNSLCQKKNQDQSHFCETSHKKSKSDGLGEVSKSYVYHNVCVGEILVRNAKELYGHCFDHLFINGIDKQ